jgi:hypothetical protein
MNFRRRHMTRLLAGSLILAGTLIGGSLGAGHAHAQFAVCYGDPLISLSNGYTLDVSSAVFTDAANVQGVTYTVTIPPNVSITKIYYPGNAAQFETVVPVQGTTPGAYDVDSVAATTQPATVAVAETLFKGWSYVKFTAASGQANSDILTHIQQ